MKTIISFEHIKIWRSKKVIAVLLLVVLGLVAMIVHNNKLDKGYWSQQEYDIGTERTRIDLLIKQAEAELSTARISAPDEVDEINQRLEFIHSQRRLNYDQSVHARFYNDDKQRGLEIWIKRDRHLLAGLEQGYEFLDANLAEVRQRLMVNEYLFQENIEPLNSPYEMTATNFIHHLSDYPWILILLVAIGLINIDMFSGDIDGGAYKFLYSQPFKRSKILASKYLVYFLNSFVLVTLVVALVFGVVALKNGIGDFSYPSFYFTPSYSSMATAGAADSPEALGFLPWSAYLLRQLPLYTLLCCFVIALIGTASFLLKSTANVLSTLICLLFIDYSIRNLFPMQSKLYMFWPLTASGLNSVLQGLYSLSSLAYVALLGTLAVILIGASLIVLNKWDLTGGID